MEDRVGFVSGVDARVKHLPSSYSKWDPLEPGLANMRPPVFVIVPVIEYKKH